MLIQLTNKSERELIDLLMDLINGNLKVGGIVGAIIDKMWPLFMKVPFLVSMWEAIFG